MHRGSLPLYLWFGDFRSQSQLLRELRLEACVTVLIVYY